MVIMPPERAAIIQENLQAFPIVHSFEGQGTAGHDRIAGALANLGHEVSDQIVGNVLRRQGIPPSPERARARERNSGSRQRAHPLELGRARRS